MSRTSKRRLPESFDTERLTLRAPRAGDGVELHAAIHESLEHLRPWMPWAEPPPTVKQTESRARDGHREYLDGTDFQLLLFLKGTDILVGSGGLHRPSKDGSCFEIGYWVRTAHARRGYITEAVAAIAEMAFAELGAQRLEIHAHEENERSWRVPERLHFVHAETRRNARLHVDGSLRDTRIYVLDGSCQRKRRP